MSIDISIDTMLTRSKGLGHVVCSVEKIQLALSTSGLNRVSIECVESVL